MRYQSIVISVSYQIPGQEKTLARKEVKKIDTTFESGGKKNQNNSQNNFPWPLLSVGCRK